jgi:hypothetical protein
MTATVAQLVEKALLLPFEDRTELIEAILEGTPPSETFLSAQMELVTDRMENVRTGKSTLIAAEKAHQIVLESLQRTP